MIEIQITYNKDVAEDVKAAHDAVMKLTGFDKVRLQNSSTVLENVNYTANWEVDLQKEVEFHKDWQAGEYMVRNKTTRYNDVVYRIIQSHTAQVGWEPDVSLSLFRRTPVVYPGEIYPRWDSIGLLDSENNWDSGECVMWNGEAWESDIDNNIYEPGVSSWTSLSQTNPTVDAWVQPTGAHDTYSVGSQVLHNGSTWESTVDNNSWEPGVYGWVQI
jgi:hypothetical protein